MSDQKMPRVVLTDIYAKDENGVSLWPDPPGCREDKLNGCTCTLVKQRHSWDPNEYGDGGKENGNDGYYGHTKAIISKGKLYYITVIDENCPLHGEAKETQDANVPTE